MTKQHYKTAIKALTHEHTSSIDSLDGSNFYSARILPQWLAKASDTLGTPAKKILADCIHYRNSMAFQYDKTLNRLAI